MDVLTTLQVPIPVEVMRMAEAQPERAVRIAVALHRFVAYVYKALKREEQVEYDAWAYTGDLLKVLAWYLSIPRAP